MSASTVACVHCGATITTLPPARGERDHLQRDVSSCFLPAPKDPSPSLLTEKDYYLLRTFIDHPEGENDFVTNLVRAKLAAAVVHSADEIDGDIVTVNSRVVFSLDGGPMETRTIVHWSREPDVGITLPVTTPIAITMLGRKSGETLSFASREGSPQRLYIEDVAYQPEAARKRENARLGLSREHDDMAFTAKRKDRHDAPSRLLPHSVKAKPCSVPGSGLKDHDPGPAAA